MKKNANTIFMVILKKLTNKKTNENIYLTTLVKLNENNKAELTKAVWLNTVQLMGTFVTSSATPLNFSIENKEVVENRGVFSRFDKGANMVILRKIEYPTYNSFLVLGITQEGLSVKEIKEKDLIAYSISKKVSPVQNAIVRKKAIFCYENAPFDTVSGTLEVKKQPVVKEDNPIDSVDLELVKEAGLTKEDLIGLNAEQIEMKLVENLLGTKDAPFNSATEENQFLLEAILEDMKRSKYDYRKIIKGTEKPFDCNDSDADFCYGQLIKQLTMEIPHFKNAKRRQIALNNAKKYFSALSDEDKRKRALDALEEISK